MYKYNIIIVGFILAHFGDAWCSPMLCSKELALHLTVNNNGLLPVKPKLVYLNMQHVFSHFTCTPV